VDEYANPAVPIALAPSSGPQIVSAIDDNSPGGFTPTLPALQGAVNYAKAHAADHPDRGTVVVLVTDGLPTTCQNPPSVAAIAEVAKQAYESEPRVLTFVVGLAAALNLDAIARQGGTGGAFLIESGDITDQFLDTINRITNTPLACQFAIPEPPSNVEQIDFEEVAVMFTPAGGGTQEIPKVQNASACQNSPNGGFYYDSPTAPSRIQVCPCSCNNFGAGRVDVTLGCKPQVGSIQ
jgi:hypothetical protein